MVRDVKIDCPTFGAQHKLKAAKILGHVHRVTATGTWKCVDPNPLYAGDELDADGATQVEIDNKGAVRHKGLLMAPAKDNCGLCIHVHIEDGHDSRVNPSPGL